MLTLRVSAISCSFFPCRLRSLAAASFVAVIAGGRPPSHPLAFAAANPALVRARTTGSVRTPPAMRICRKSVSSVHW
jgi:hypothetical protein